MGRSKALLPVAGDTLLGWQLARLAPGFAEVLVSGGEELEAAARGTRLVPDLRRGRQGPLAGVEVGLRVARHEALLAVGCDLPRVGESLLARLLEASRGHDAAAPRLLGRPETACACYRRSALPVIARRLDAGANKAQDALAELDTAWLDDVDPDELWNLNTQQDYQVFLSAL